MKRFLAIALAATVGLAFASTAAHAVIADGSYGATPGSVTGYTAGLAANGITGSRHNLGSMGIAITATPTTGGSSTSEVCVFCHTPHHTVQGTSGGSVISTVVTPNTIGIGSPDYDGLGTDTTINVIGGDGTTAGTTTVSTDVFDGLGNWIHTDQVITIVTLATGTSNDYSPAPLWNRRSVATSFTAYGSTIGGTNPTGTGLTVGGVTLACLSCHDGVTTFDNLVNYPGAGGLQSIYGDAGRSAGTANDGNQVANWTFIDEGEAGQGGTLGGEARLNIGNSGGNLSNDHPMSIPYNGSDSATPRASLRARDTVIANVNLTQGLYTADAALAENLNQNRWAVKGFISTTATINDLLRNGNVECSSCHDPHFKNLSNVDLDMSTIVNDWDVGNWTESITGTGKKHDGTQNLLSNRVVKTDGLFLRRVGGNAGSGLCRTCHNK